MKKHRQKQKYSQEKLAEKIEQQKASFRNMRENQKFCNPKEHKFIFKWCKVKCGHATCCYECEICGYKIHT